MIYNELYRHEHLRPNTGKASNIYTSVWKATSFGQKQEKNPILPELRRMGGGGYQCLDLQGEKNRATV
jgi:hypothetical protein